MPRGVLILCAIFCSPLYFALRQRWLAAAVNALVYGLAVLLVASLVLAPAGAVCWLLGLAHALWDLGKVMREDTLRRQAELIAEKTAPRQGVWP